MSHPDGASNWLEIHNSSIENNIRLLKTITRTEVMAVVKANGYGHGIVEAARSAESAEARYCGVARIEEAREIRKSGIGLPLLVLGHTPPDQVADAVAVDVSLSIFELGQIEQVANASRVAGKKARIHIKVDTGMSRLGAPPQRALELLQLCDATDEIELEGLFTHFANADEPASDINGQQERLFREVVSEAEAAGLRPALVHASNSAAALSRPSARFDMVRSGIAIYGMAPSKAVNLPEGFEPGLLWKARFVQIRRLAGGIGVSYGHTYITSGQETIGVLPVGYGDGYRRMSGGEVLVHGVRAPIVGRVCMDQLMVHIDGIPDVRVGDEAVLIGGKGSDAINVEELADRWETIPYEVTCGISARVPRYYDR